MRRKIIFGLMLSLGFILILTAFSFINNHSKADNITLIDPNGQSFTSGYNTLIMDPNNIYVNINTSIPTGGSGSGAQPPYLIFQSFNTALVNLTITKPNPGNLTIKAYDVNDNLKTPAAGGLKAFHLNEELKGDGTTNPTFNVSSEGTTITGTFVFDTSPQDITAGNYPFVFEATDLDGLKGYAFAWINVTTTPTYTLNVNSSPDTGAVITVSPADINSQGDGTTNFIRTYNQNQVVTLTAPATHSGNNFSNWTGVDSQNGRQATVTMTSARTATANYSAVPTYTLNVNSTDTGAVITVSPADINSQGDGTTNFIRTYNQNQVVTLTAPATHSGKNFSNWTGVDTQINTQATVTMTSARTATANYSSGGGGAVCPGDGSKTTPFCMKTLIDVGGYSVNSSGAISVGPSQIVYFVVDPVGFSIPCNAFSFQWRAYDGGIWRFYKFRRYKDGRVDSTEIPMGTSEYVENAPPNSFDSTMFVYGVKNLSQTETQVISLLWQK